jgi:nucleotide-binding universal stress UspA family protein
MMSERVPAGENVTASNGATSTEPTFRRVLIPVLDASQADNLVELARRVGATEARVLHLNLRESIAGRQFPIETAADASYVVEAAVFELRMAGIGASGQIGYVLVGKAGEAIVEEASKWGADLIVLGVPRRAEFATRLFGSVTLRVLQHAQCPVLVASSARSEHVSPVAEEQLTGTRS